MKSTPHKSHYHLLGVHRMSSVEDIKIAYRKKARRAHPDHGGNADTFAHLTEAYRTLTVPKLKEAYDKALGKEGDKCAACKGKGYTAKQISLSERTTAPCKECHGSGIILK